MSKELLEVGTLCRATDWLIYLLHIFYDIMHIIKSLTDKRGTS